MIKDEYYSRDVSVKEIAVYQSYDLDFWNVWGSGNEGRIKSDGARYFYLVISSFVKEFPLYASPKRRQEASSGSVASCCLLPVASIIVTSIFAMS
jgi:hypothetical protein